MDSLTHIILGGAIGQIIGRGRTGRWGFCLGAWAATVPDLDVFWYTGHPVADHLMHRTFMHALIMIPVLSLFALHPFLLSRTVRRQWKMMWLLAAVAMLSHPFLDACTSYGTMMFWPFSQKRVAWDSVSVVDPIFTVLILAGTWMAAWKKKWRFAAMGIAAGVIYLGFGFWQHHRAWIAQEQLAAVRGERVERGRVMPTLGNLRVWRSIYLSDGVMHVDAVEVPFFDSTRVARGTSLPQSRTADLDPAVGNAARHDFAAFFDFTGGFVGKPRDDGLYADERYSLETAGFEPFWGIKVDGPEATWQIITPRNIWAMPRYIWREAWGRNANFVDLDDIKPH